MNIRRFIENNLRRSCAGWLLLSSLLYVSCGNEDVTDNGIESGDPVPVNIVLGNVNDFSASPEVASRSAEPRTQAVMVKMDDEHTALVNVQREEATPQTRAVTPLAAGVKFRVLAYLNSVSTSNFRAAADYEVLSGGGVSLIDGGLELPAGTYQFVCYSYNNSSALPSFDGTLQTVVTGIPNGTDFLWTQVIQTISDTSQNVNINFYHACSQLKVRVDASDTEENVTSSIAVVSGLENNTASWDVTTSFLNVQSGDALNMQFVWNAPSAQVVDSEPRVLMPFTDKDLTLNFTNITVGGTAYSNKSVALKGVTLTQGNSYVCTVTFVSSGDGSELGGDDNRANCYIVAPGKTYSLNAKYMGNSTTLVDGADGARLVWQTDKDLISNVTYNNGVIYFTVKENTPGNAIIAVTDGTNGSGPILWSWHIWITDFNPDSSDGQGKFGAYIFMKRNLGALSGGQGNPTTRGCYYQWGRKDPFPGTATWEAKETGTYGWRTPVYDASGQLIPPASQVTSSASFTILESIQKPQIYNYYYSSNPNTYYWAKDRYANMWEEGPNSPKSIYDPCPAGWRVPVKEAFANIKTENIVLTAYGVEISPIGYFPYGGYGFSTTNIMTTPSSSINYFSATNYSTNQGNSLYITSSGTVSISSSYQSHLQNVRCVKDWTLSNSR